MYLSAGRTYQIVWNLQMPPLRKDIECRAVTSERTRPLYEIITSLYPHLRKDAEVI